jgi:hypothetical protein
VESFVDKNVKVCQRGGNNRHDSKMPKKWANKIPFFFGGKTNTLLESSPFFIQM